MQDTSNDCFIIADRNMRVSNFIEANNFTEPGLIITHIRSQIVTN